MAFITLGTATQLQIKVPTIGSTDWADTMRTDTFLKIAQHQHTGSADGAQLGTGSLVADAVTGAKIRLDNNEYLRARNAADSANVNMIKIDANDDLYIDPEIAKLLIKNDTYVTARNNADSADVNVFKLTTADKLDIGPEISSVIKISNNVALQHRNAADSAYIDTIKVNASDKVVLGADLASLAIINDTFIQARNNADSAYIDILKVTTADKLTISPEISSVIKLSNNIALQHRNQADSAYIDTIKVNTSDLIVLGAEVVSIQTNTVNAGATAVTLTDNTVIAADASVITLSTDESCRIRYRLVRNGSTQEGVLSFTDVSTIPSESFTGTDVGVTFSVSSGALYYTTTSTGSNVSMYYTILK